jgi:hypothetical protein
MDKRVSEMPDLSLIDAAYGMIERLEGRKRALKLVIGGCIFASLSGFGINSFVFMTHSHQKGVFPDNIMVLSGVLLLACIGMIIIGIDRYLILRKLDDRMDQIKRLEETIYKEVLESKID